MIGWLVLSLKITDRFSFVHIPKTGGTSIRQSLLKQVGAVCNYPVTMGWCFGHYTALHKLERDADEWNKRFTFAFVRNPWDHAVSYYEFSRTHKPIFQGYDTFNEWVLDGMPTGATAFWRTDQQIDDILLMKQWVCDLSGKIIVDHIGQFETLQADYDLICDKICIPSSILPVMNQSQRGPYQDYYTLETQDLVAERNTWVIEEFGYDF